MVRVHFEIVAYKRQTLGAWDLANSLSIDSDRDIISSEDISDCRECF
jgi:hypothetical protein